MLPDPLHPAVVHFPVVLAALLPVVAGVALAVLLKKGFSRGPWIVVVATSMALAGTAWMAIETGEEEEEVVEDVVSESVIHDHEEAAEAFLITAGITALILATGLLPGLPGTAGRYAGTAMTLAVLIMGVRVGHSGGELVYVHGAGQAYTSGTASGGDSDRSSRATRDDDDDDDDDDRRDE
ncbi:MAG: hypothetical protein OEZ65_10655 [Gemmatimonadota bacterium]|nr:hypothetical protein [Gemmatimonadota bacterium]MDH5760038.1 hypothetical protein [Gemmatimonadota bacterium]